MKTKLAPCFQNKKPTKQIRRTINVEKPLRSPISVDVQEGELDGNEALANMLKFVMLSKVKLTVKLLRTKLATGGDVVVVVVEGQS